jgi:hypothetical protein
MDIATLPTVVIGHDRLSYIPRWDAETLPGNTIAIDTETELIDGDQIPRLALVSVSSGRCHALVHPDDLGVFLLAHRDRHFVAHNFAFDFAASEKHLRDRGEDAAVDCLWQTVEENRAHDTMILDGLYRLAMHGSYPSSRDLGTLAMEYSGIELDKNNPYRKRFGETLDLSWDAVEPGYFEYAIKDPIATWRVHAVLRQRSVDRARQCGVTEEAIRRWGVFTEYVQIRAAIALDWITRNGFCLDLGLAEHAQEALQTRLQEHLDRLIRHPRGRELFKMDPKTGELKLTKSRAPRFSLKVLREILQGAAGDIEREAGLKIPIPLTDKGAISTSGKEWADYSRLHPFLADWVEMTETASLVKFFQQLGNAVVHPKYSVLVRSGRTSCSAPNIQQVPRQGGFRESFVPSPGHFLLAIDYAFIELRTLAAECEARYGHSRLAEVIRTGRDPHAYAAALLTGQDPDEFLRLRETDPETFKRQRQAAKPLNFGIPGSLGAASLVTYARRTYGVEMSMEQAQDFRAKMITEVYPEWSQYLSEDAMAILAQNLETTPERCWLALDWSRERSPSVPWVLRRIVRGENVRKDGRPYSQNFIRRVWTRIQLINRSCALAPLLAKRQGSEELEQLLFGSRAVTLTGRVRGRVGFSAAKNTPFQGLSADGAKLALWRLMREGYRVVGFVHDEVLIELPDEGGYVSETKV